MRKPMGTWTFEAPVAAITRGREIGERHDTIIILARWSLPGGFCVPMGGQYAVFTPTEEFLESPLLPRLRGYAVEDWYTFKLSRIESQATCPVLRLADVLVQPAEALQAHFRKSSFLLPSEHEQPRPGQEELPEGVCTGQAAECPRRFPQDLPS